MTHLLPLAAPAALPWLMLQRDEALRAARLEQAQLQQDLHLMLAARGSLAALQASLQKASAAVAAM
jgi:hypothetical protein